MSNPNDVLNLFAVPTMAIGVDRSYYQTIHPCNAIQHYGPFEFQIPANNFMVALNRTYVVFEMRICKADGTALNHGAVAADKVKVSPVQYVGSSMFSQVKMYLHGHEVSDVQNYGYRGYMEHELHLSQEMKETMLQMTGYAKEVPDANGSLDNEANTGFVSRGELLFNGHWVEYVSRLHLDMCQQNKLLLPLIDVRFLFVRATDNFLLKCYKAGSTENYRVEVRNIRLLWKVVEPSKDMVIALEDTLVRAACRYSINRTEVRTLNIPVSVTKTPENILSTGQLPQLVIVGIVPAVGYNGDYTHTPYFFNNYKIRHVSIVAAGVPFPTRTRDLNYNAGTYVEAFIDLYKNLSLTDSQDSNGLDMKSFKHFHNFYAFDLTPFQTPDGSFSLPQSGSVSLEIDFMTAVSQELTAIVYMVYNSMVLIDRYRNIFKNFKS